LPTDKEILEKWMGSVRRDDRSGYMPRVRGDMERAKQTLEPLEIWLGGPGRKHELFQLRRCLRKLLIHDSFRAYFSEDYSSGADLASKEQDEVESLDMIIILALTPGSSAEAIEFANTPHLLKKLYIFIPGKYRNGYVFKSLSSDRHRVIIGDSLFSLDKAKEFDDELAMKVLYRARTTRNRVYQANKLRQECGT